MHFVRNMHGHCRPSERGLVSAALREIFNAPDRAAAQAHLGEVLERFHGPQAKIAELLEAAEEDLLAFYRFRPPTPPSCTQPTRWSASTRRSGAAPTSSASSPTTPPRSA